MIRWSDVLGCMAAVDTRATSGSGFNRTGEVGGVGEGDFLLEWCLDFDLCVIHSSGPPSSARNVEGPRSRVKNKGDTHPVQNPVGSSLPVWSSGSDWG